MKITLDWYGPRDEESIKALENEHNITIVLLDDDPSDVKAIIGETKESIRDFLLAYGVPEDDLRIFFPELSQE